MYVLLASREIAKKFSFMVIATCATPIISVSETMPLSLPWVIDPGVEGTAIEVSSILPGSLLFVSLAVHPEEGFSSQKLFGYGDAVFELSISDSNSTVAISKQLADGSSVSADLNEVSFADSEVLELWLQVSEEGGHLSVASMTGWLFWEVPVVGDQEIINFYQGPSLNYAIVDFHLATPGLANGAAEENANLGSLSEPDRAEEVVPSRRFKLPAPLLENPTVAELTDSSHLTFPEVESPPSLNGLNFVRPEGGEYIFDPRTQKVQEVGPSARIVTE